MISNARRSIRAIRRSTLAASAVAVLVLAVGVSACGDDDSSDSGESGEETIKIGFVVKTLSTEYWTAWASKADEVAAANPGVEVEITGASSEGDARGQIAKVEDLLLQEIDALVIVPMSDALGPVLQRAVDQGVKVVLGESPVTDFDDYTSLVGVDQAEAAASGAEFVVEQLADQIDGSKVATLVAPGIGVVEDRNDAAIEVFEGAGAELVAEGPATECGLPQALSSSEDILQANPDLLVIYATCAPPDIGAIQATKQAGLTPNEDVYVFGFDGLPEEFAAIQAGDLLGTIDQRPDLQGEAAMEAAISAVKGEDVPRTTSSGYDIVSKENVEEAIAAQEEATRKFR